MRDHNQTQDTGQPLHLVSTCSLLALLAAAALVCDVIVVVTDDDDGRRLHVDSLVVVFE